MSGWKHMKSSDVGSARILLSCVLVTLQVPLFEAHMCFLLLAASVSVCNETFGTDCVQHLAVATLLHLAADTRTQMAKGSSFA